MCNKFEEPYDIDEVGFPIYDEMEVIPNNLVILDFTDEGHKCTCGNYDALDGFSPCLFNGEIVEPNDESGWDGLYICNRCGQMWDYIGD